MAKMEQWYVEEDIGGYVLRGYVSGHRRIADGRFIRSSHICDCKKLDYVYMITSHHTKYYCRFRDCDFSNCVTASFLEDFAMIKETYMEKRRVKMEKELGSANLCNWYLTPQEDGTWIAHGNVTKHSRITDSCYINTTAVQEIELQEDAAIICTQNTRYTCEFDKCDWEKEESYVKIPNLESLKGQYLKKETIDIPNYSILLRLSNGQEYYYDGAWVREDAEAEKLQMFPHVGMMRDSVIISDEMMLHDLRYFPSDGHMRFYDWSPNGKTVYIENTGDRTVFVTTSMGVFSIEPKERKCIVNENINPDIDKDALPDYDLYGAWLI